jgi:hypothetical protein
VAKERPSRSAASFVIGRAPFHMQPRAGEQATWLATADIAPRHGVRADPKRADLCPRVWFRRTIRRPATGGGDARRCAAATEPVDRPPDGLDEMQEAIENRIDHGNVSIVKSWPAS